MALIALLSFVTGFMAVSQLYPLDKKVCCVAGRYNGWQQNYVKPNCPKPLKEKFVMVLKQERGCGPNVWGTITDSSGLVNNWTGTLSLGLRGCCKLEGSFLTPGGDLVKFSGTICMTLGKWKAKGTWVEIGSTDPCRGSGVWEMAQL
jgi:hypothetical protein